jgi:ceramide glucosyltransferase
VRTDLRSIAEKLTLAATLGAIGYALFAHNRVRAFGRRIRRSPPPQPPGSRPAITILKPTHGLEPGLEENLRSFCEQDYPDFEVVLGVQRPDDPALDVITRVATAFPDRATIVVGDGEPRFRNPKIANVAPMIARVRGSIIIIADSDMRVTPDYLAAVAAAFDDPGVGAVTAIFRGEPADPGLASALGAMGMTEQFAPSTLVAKSVEPVRYTFGATMAVRRDVFDAIGGVAALGGRLADDHALGHLVTEAGYRVAFADYVVTNVVDERDLLTLVRHETRWMRTIRSVRLISYLGIPVTYPLPVALVHLALARNKLPALVLATVALYLRIRLHVSAHDELGTGRRPPSALVLLRDLLGITVWAFGLCGSRVRWRDKPLTFTARGHLHPRS